MGREMAGAWAGVGRKYGRWSEADWRRGECAGADISVEPEFSEEARKAKVAGNVLVNLWVDEKGNPSACACDSRSRDGSG